MASNSVPELTKPTACSAVRSPVSQHIIGKGAEFEIRIHSDLQPGRLPEDGNVRH